MNKGRMMMKCPQNWKSIRKFKLMTRKESKSHLQRGQKISSIQEFKRLMKILKMMETKS